MPEQAPYRGDDLVNAETQHEKSDVNVRALGWALVIFIVFAAVTHGVLYLQFHLYRRYFRDQPSQPLTMMARSLSLPPNPRLQPFPSAVVPPNANTPVTDMQEMRATEDEAMNKAAWVDREKGIVRLPIDVAKRLTVQRLSVGAVAPSEPAAVAKPAAENAEGMGAKP